MLNDILNIAAEIIKSLAVGAAIVMLLLSALYLGSYFQ